MDHEPYYEEDGYDYGYDEYVEVVPTYKLSEAMQNNLLYLRKAITDCNVYEIQNIYENQLTKLMDQYQKPLPPPQAPEMEHILNNDLFTIIYKELYYRQIYASGQPTLSDRFESYYNYVNLFNYILTPSGPISLELPNQWLWEIMDDFIYQFQCFSIYRSKLDKMTPEEIALCKSNPKMWNVHSVLNVLHSLVARSNINQQLQVFGRGGTPEEVAEVAGEYGSRPLYKMLGYFSLIGLLRLHSQLGDYYQAIKVLEHLDLHKKSYYTRVPACQVATYYYVGFAYMMMRRYEDAIRTFSSVLVYIMRTKPSFQPRGYQMAQINKQTDKMFALLSICIALHPQRTDESILQQMKAKVGDNMPKMQQGDVDVFDAQFQYGCPKFLSPVSPFNYEWESLDSKAIQSLALAPLNQQLNVFRGEVEAQLHIPTIRSFLKLYTTMPVEKLSKFLDPPLYIVEQEPPYTEQELLRHFHRQLMSFKHLMNNMVCPEGSSSLQGDFQTASDMDFFIDKDMIHIADTKIARKYGDYFIRQYHKFDEMYQAIRKLQP